MLRNFLVLIFLHSILLYRISEGTPIIGQASEIVEQDEFKKDFAFMGSLGEFSRCGVHKKFDRHYCGGALISKRHVLTAAHCLKTSRFRGTMVTFGSTELNRGLSYEMSTWITYKAWAFRHGERFSDIDLYDDIAIITLSSDVNGITPAVISKLNDHDIVRQKVVAIGWGLSDEKRDKRPRKMQKAYLTVLDASDCEKKLSKIFGPMTAAHDNEYCTHASPPVILGCGDSGGPLLLNSTKEIVGINSSVCDVKKPHKNPNAVNLHIKVRRYEKFIKDVVNSSLTENVS